MTEGCSEGLSIPGPLPSLSTVENATSVHHSAFPPPAPPTWVATSRIHHIGNAPGSTHRPFPKWSPPPAWSRGRFPRFSAREGRNYLLLVPCQSSSDTGVVGSSGRWRNAAPFGEVGNQTNGEVFQTRLRRRQVRCVGGGVCQPSSAIIK